MEPRAADQRPFHLSLVLTHACNLACGYCYMGEHHVTAMPAAVAERALRLAFAQSPAVDVGFFGGEPLLAWDMLMQAAAFARDLAATAEQRSVRFQVTTNATLLDRPRAAALRDMGVEIAVSLDGEARSHDGGRPLAGGGSSFGRALAGIQALRDEAVPFQVVAVVTPENVRDLCQNVRFLDSLEPVHILLNPAWEAPWNDEDTAAWSAQLTELSLLWEARLSEERPLPLPLFAGKLAAAARGARGAECSVGRWNAAVAPSGNLYPCDRLVADDRERRWVVGHLDEGFESRRHLPRGHHDPACGPCAEQFRCGASCACANIAETGTPDHAGGVQCWYEQTVAELADAAGLRLLEKGHAAFTRAAYGPLISDMLTGKIPRPRRLHVLP